MVERLGGKNCNLQEMLSAARWKFGGVHVLFGMGELLHVLESWKAACCSACESCCGLSCLWSAMVGCLVQGAVMPAAAGKKWKLDGQQLGAAHGSEVSLAARCVAGRCCCSVVAALDGGHGSKLSCCLGRGEDEQVARQQGVLLRAVALGSKACCCVQWRWAARLGGYVMLWSCKAWQHGLEGDAALGGAVEGCSGRRRVWHTAWWLRCLAAHGGRAARQRLLHGGWDGSGGLVAGGGSKLGWEVLLGEGKLALHGLEEWTAVVRCLALPCLQLEEFGWTAAVAMHGGAARAGRWQSCCSWQQGVLLTVEEEDGSARWLAVEHGQLGKSGLLPSWWLTVAVAQLASAGR